MAPQRAGQKRKVVEVPRPVQQEEDDALGNGLFDGAIDDGSSSDEGASEEDSEEEEFDEDEDFHLVVSADGSPLMVGDSQESVAEWLSGHNYGIVALH